jgi:hypothetical protein
MMQIADSLHRHVPKLSQFNVSIWLNDLDSRYVQNIEVIQLFHLCHSEINSLF